MKVQHHDDIPKLFYVYIVINLRKFSGSMVQKGLT